LVSFEFERMDGLYSVRLVFIGASAFGLKCLRTCIDLADVQVVGVVTAPRNFSISYRPHGVRNVRYADLREVTDANGIPIVTIGRSMTEPPLLKKVTSWQPDAYLVAGWYHMIPKSWRALAPAYGLHASLLPDYCGGAPLVWAIIKGEKKTGITLFQMDDGVDSGPIAGQREELISPDDTIGTLYARIEQRGIELLREALPAMAAGTLRLHPQDHSRRRLMPQRAPEDGLIDWSEDAEAIVRFVRAQTRPYPGAFTTLDGKILRIWAAALADRFGCGEIGVVRKAAGDEYVVCTKNGAVRLQEVGYEHENYLQAEIAKLLGGGGQRLGLPLTESD
jgi:methionyl-tRNA formyltransferase